MRHVVLTCINHTNLRWQCKEIAVNAIGQYNGMRNIFYIGSLDGSYYPECSCRVSDLRFAPEELERQKIEPLES